MKAIIRTLLLSFLVCCVLPLSACKTAGTAPPVTTSTPAQAAGNSSLASIVGMIQTDYPGLKLAAQAYAALPTTSASEVTAINNAIQTADPIVASLSATSAPQDIQVVLTAMATLVTHQSGVSSNTKSDIALALNIISTLTSAASVFTPLVSLF